MRYLCRATRFEISFLQFKPNDDYYHRTAATSPFQSSSNTMSDTIVQHSAGPSSSINQIPDIIVSQQTVLSPKLSDELVRRHQAKQYEDYESDDELRREDISFPIDGGKFLISYPKKVSHHQLTFQ